MELRRLIDVARDEKCECERQLAVMKRDVEGLTLQLQQKDSELDRARHLVRYLMPCQ